MKLYESVINFSVSKDEETFLKLVNLASNSNVNLLNYSKDDDYNRSVFTLIGQENDLFDLIIAMVEIVIDNVDMNFHKGEHPRIGAVDVIPIIPIKNVTMHECIVFSKKIGKEIFKRFSLPVYFYEESTDDEYRKNLANIRDGGFENLNRRIENGFSPDLGNKIHKTAGAVVVGAREFLVAYNINLNTNDIKIAEKISMAIRHKDGGFKYCKAIPIYLKSRDIVAVSINFINYKRTPIFRVFEVVKLEAKRYGVSVIESELIGACPNKALIDAACYYLQLNNFDYDSQIIN